MALLEILPDSNPLMRKTSKRIRHVDAQLRQLVEDMYETMVDGWGIGLAAIQVGVPKRFFVYEIPKREIRGYETCKPDMKTADNPDSVEDAPSDNLMQDDIPSPEPTENDEIDEDEEPDAGYTGNFTVCINPRIISREGAIIDDEGCLSKSGWLAKVERAYKVTFQAYDLDMRKFERTVTGLEARCIQHETDHLDGILFTDRCIAGSLHEVVTEEEPAKTGTTGDGEAQPEVTGSELAMKDSTIG